MADDSEERPSTSHDFTSTKAAIFDTFNKLKKWREEQVQQFRSMQFLESQKLMQLSGESQKRFEKLLENASKTCDTEERPKSVIPESSDTSALSLKNDLENYDTLQESSITGHLQRCFDDSSWSNLSVCENRVNSATEKEAVLSELQNFQISGENLNEKEGKIVKNETGSSSSVKTKRPFLRKGTGLLRYRPKSSPNGQPAKNKQRNNHLPQKSLLLKPAIRKTDTHSENVKHIRFDIPVASKETDTEPLAENNIPTTSKFVGNVESNFNRNDKYTPLSYSSNVSPAGNNKVEEVSDSGCENLNLSEENKELEEFEMLESCAQNSSFNSDSSVVQRILHGDFAESFPTSQKEMIKLPINNNMKSTFKEMYKSTTENSIFSPKVGLSKCLEEAHIRKEILQKVISDINPRIQSLQKEICRSKQEDFDDSDVGERCSTPVEDLSMEHEIMPSTVPERDVNEIREEMCPTDCKSCRVDGILNDFCPAKDNLLEEDSISGESEYENKQALDEKSKIRDKLQELEKEIQIYQELNAKLSSKCKERNEFLRKLQKERDDFNKHKEAEKKKLEAEMEEERRQIKRQKETFTRYQKLRRDNPTRKEREEFSSLRQEIEKLQEDLKRQKIKYTGENRKLRNQLEVAERERDSFKLENIRLEEQCQDLLTALKTRLKKKPSNNSLNKMDDVCDTVHEDMLKKYPTTKDAECQTQIKDLNSEVAGISEQVTLSPAVKKTKAKVRFNLTPEYKKNPLEDVMENLECRIGNQYENGDFENRIENQLKSETLKNGIESQSKNEDFLSEENSIITDHNKDRIVEKEIEADNLSTISVSAECEFKEIDHGNKIEKIYASGEREIIFDCGTRKIISADGESTKFLFRNGVVKEIFPDKREVYKYVNGVTETRFSDGLEVTEFPNGHIQKCHPNGHKEVAFPDGSIHHTYADGSEKVHTADGNVVILSADGTKTVEFANGQREIRTATYKRREFPDGSVKIFYDSGRQETRYSNGRIRIKDREGKVLVDTKYVVTKG